jgi:hypothetical protein
MTEHRIVTQDERLGAASKRSASVFVPCSVSNR